MKLTIFLSAIALMQAGAQPAPMKPAPATTAMGRPAERAGGGEVPAVSLQAIRNLEKEMDSRLAVTGGKNPCNVLSPTRGLYIAGLGAVFSAEVELAATPGGVGLFQTTVGPQQKAKYHGDKAANVPQLEQTLRDMAVLLSNSPVLKLSDSDQVVVAARLVYRSWEDTTGLPGQIVAHLDRRGSVVKMEVQ